MKKFFLSVAVVATLVFSSCSGPSLCDCAKIGEQAMKEFAEAGTDEAKVKALEEKYKSKSEACDKLVKSKTAEQLQEEAKKCN